MTVAQKRRSQATAEDVRKSSIRSSVQVARAALRAGIEQRLALLGVFHNGNRIPRGEVNDQWSAERERPGIEAALGRWEQQGYTPGAAVERFIRETSYTWLNRLAALRALEVRGLIRPITPVDASRRAAVMASVEAVCGALLQAREIAEALIWQSVFAELALQVGALFDPLDPHGFFPGSSAVLGALEAIGSIDDETWREDDTLGWWYQFFTTKNERAELRTKKGAAFTPDDLGPINQFYTPKWVVRYLVDNTLGTLWRRMVPETTIGEFCTLQLPATPDDTPLPRKRVRDIRLIDPACGTMHFGVYAFDVLVRMYEEEAIEPAAEVPQLILERNLAGIDIDRRAIQIAALNLYLKAVTRLRDVGIAEFPPLRLNLGCADAPPPSAKQRHALRASISDPALAQAVDVALNSLEYLHAVGSLLDVERDVREALAKKMPALLPGMSPLPGLLAQIGIVDNPEPSALETLVARAREIAEDALRADDMAGALAAEDALLAAKVLSLVNQRYDVVVMNPPYGELMPPLTKEYLHRRYTQSKSDIYGAFFELAFRLADGGGAVGALTSKTFLYLDSFKHIRKLFLELGRLCSLVDGGGGILYESNVDVGAIIGWSERARAEARASVFRLVREPDRALCLQNVVAEIRRHYEVHDDVLYQPLLRDLRKLPTQTLAYWAPPALLAAYAKYPPLEPTYGEVRQGLATGDDKRFLRYWWEVPKDQIGQGKRWVPFAKGGEYSPFYESLLRVVDWGAEPDLAKSGNHLPSRRYYFREGITYPRIADRFHARELPAGAIFADKGPSIFGSFTLALLGYLNTRVAQTLLMAQSVTRLFEVGQLRRLCVPDLKSELGEQLASIARESVAAGERFATGDELDRRFTESWVEQQPTQSLAEAIAMAVKFRKAHLMALETAQRNSTDLVGRALDFAESDWSQLERTFGAEIREDKGARTSRNIDVMSKPEEQAKRVLSSLCQSVVQKRRVVLVHHAAIEVRSALSKRFNESSDVVALETLIGKSLLSWCSADYAPYHAAIRFGRPFIVRLETRRQLVQLLLDLVNATPAILRAFIVSDLEPAKDRVAAQVTAVSGGAQRVALQAELEDYDELIGALLNASERWTNEERDARLRIAAVAHLCSYAK